MTPACRSARTLVVPPGVVENLFVCGEGEGVIGEGEVAVRSVVDRVEREVGDARPSSARARAFPMWIWMRVEKEKKMLTNSCDRNS